MSDVKIDIAKMMARKEGIVEKKTKGIDFLFRKNKITWLNGHGTFTGKTDAGVQIEVSGEGETEVVTAKNVIIATGSKARHLPGIPFDNKIVVDNDGALAFDAVPKKLAVIGAGVIGLEMGSVWRRLGAEVTVLEALPEFLGAADQALAKEAAKQFTKQGLEIQLGVKVGEVKTTDNSVSIAYTDKDGNAQTLERDRLIVSIGRVPNTDNLGLRSDRPEARRARLHRRRRPLRDEPCRTCARSATWCAARCSRTRPKTKACWSPNSSTARSRISTSTPFRG